MRQDKLAEILEACNYLDLKSLICELIRSLFIIIHLLLRTQFA